MNMPNVDLQQLLNPPSIIEYYKPAAGLESHLDVTQIVMLTNPSCDSSAKNKKEILAELMRPLRIEYFFDEKTGFYYGLMFDPNNSDDKRPPFAVQVYYVDSYNQPTQIHKVIYPKQGKILVIYYRDSNDNFSSDGIINWAKHVKVNCIEIDDDGNKREFEEVFEHFRKTKERRKDEGRVLPA